MIGQTAVVAGHVARLARTPHFAATSATVGAGGTVAGLRVLGITPDLDPQVLARGLQDGNLWFALVLAAAFGAIGGLVAELLSLHGNIELPHRVKRGQGNRTRLADPRDMVDLGVLSRMLLGASAALALLSAYTPTTASALLVNGLIAGYASTAVFRFVQARLLGASSTGKPPRQLRPLKLSDKAA
jgi:hypothetical protein